MYQLHSSLSNVLLGTMDTTADAAAISERYEAAGGDADRLLVLRGRDGIEALEGRASGSLMSSWTRQLNRACDTIIAHIVDTAVEDLRNGCTVLVVRHVDSRVAEAESQRLRGMGASHLHHSGRWTSVEHGAVPTSGSTWAKTAIQH